MTSMISQISWARIRFRPDFFSGFSFTVLCITGMINHIFITVAQCCSVERVSLHVREDVSTILTIGIIIFLFIFISLFYFFLLSHTFITKKLPKGSAFSSDACFCFRKKNHSRNSTSINFEPEITY